MDRKTKDIMITLSAGIIKDKDESIKLANRIKVFLKRLGIKKKYRIDAIIGVSEHNVHSGKFVAVKTGKRGRPKKIFEFNDDYDLKNKPDLHLHVLINGCPADQIANCLMSYLNKIYVKSLDKNRKSVCRKTDCSEYRDYAEKYVLNQSSVIRKLDYVPNEEIILTNEEYTDSEQNIENMAIADKCKVHFGLECNKEKYIYVYKKYRYISIKRNKEQYKYLVIVLVPP